MFRLFLPRTHKGVFLCLSLFLFPVLLLLTGCRNYLRDEVEIDGRQHLYKEYKLLSNDSVRVNYGVTISGARAAKDFKVTVLNRDSSIRVGVTPSQNATGDASFDVTYHTKGTPTGAYPVKLVISNSEGAFLEVIALLKVTSLYDLLAQKNLLDISDTIGSAPYYSGTGRIYEYETTISKAAGAPAGEYLFSQLGVTNILGNAEGIKGVRVQIDSVTGALVAPLQAPGFTLEYSGTGKLFFRPDSYSASGYFWSCV